MEGVASLVRTFDRSGDITEDTRTDTRVRIDVDGVVQGVGFRPFLYALACELALSGEVCNTPNGVRVHVEGDRRNVTRFLERLEIDAPPHSRIHGVSVTPETPRGANGFEIRRSTSVGAKTALVLPDIAVCDVCLAEMRDPDDRRYRYPFINCTHCGPRYSIIRRIPYDRSNTTMARFDMCPDCRAEYEDPADRRFHAQPVACPVCGPQTELWAAGGALLERKEDAVVAAIEALRAGKIVAVKGIGGFHLMCDARDSDAVNRLRRRKRRPKKPFAVMYPDLEAVGEDALVPAPEEAALVSSEAPIVLLRRRQRCGVASEVAPGLATIGAMLPYAPLHHLLLEELGTPLVATSANLSEEPICTDEREAVDRLAGIADLFLVHDRPIERAVDDSVVRVIDGAARVLRRARGYAPLPILTGVDGPQVLAVGGHLKNSVAVTHGNRVFLSQHIGDLETEAAYSAFLRAHADLRRLFDVDPEIVACDVHPDYASSRWAEDAGYPVQPVQHHYAHILSVMAEHDLCGPVLGVSWDGAGFGEDGGIRGGEFLRCTLAEYTRVASLRQFPLPGGDKAAKEPRRAALGLLFAAFGSAAFGDVALGDAVSGERLSRDAVSGGVPGETAGWPNGVVSGGVPGQAARRPNGVVSGDVPGETAAWPDGVPPPLRAAIEGGVHTPATTSAGRLFDALASLLGICHINAYEGQAAMQLEEAAMSADAGRDYAIAMRDGEQCRELDWFPLLESVLGDLSAGVEVSAIALGVHRALAAAIVSVAADFGLKDVVLSGGCFQSKLLTERAAAGLRREGFRVWLNESVPPNDGGIALGQAVHGMRAGGGEYVSRDTGRNCQHQR